ncbi:MAG: GTP cyclohydrolase FolE2 [Verrucomicrobiota bacterium]
MSEFDPQSLTSRELRRSYDATFTTSDGYRDSLPDPQNAEAPEGLDIGSEVKQVGISNFKLPLKIRTADDSDQIVEASITGTVPCVSGRRGINMGRIMRVFYEFREEVFTPLLLERILRAYGDELTVDSARLKIRFSYPIKVPALRSGLEGIQFYKCAYEGRLSKDCGFDCRVEFDFVYASACPCSADLAEHAEETRDTYAVPHSQRSKARIWTSLAPGADLTLEDLHAICLNALKTETQVMVRREDEQAFAELNGANLKFVEDAARLLHRELTAHPAIRDFQIACAHLESLHSHDAVAVMVKGVEGGYSGDFDAFEDLVV